MANKNKDEQRDLFMALTRDYQAIMMKEYMRGVHRVKDSVSPKLVAVSMLAAVLESCVVSLAACDMCEDKAVDFDKIKEVLTELVGGGLEDACRNAKMTGAFDGKEA